MKLYRSRNKIVTLKLLKICNARKKLGSWHQGSSDCPAFHHSLDVFPIVTLLDNSIILFNNKKFIFNVVNNHDFGSVGYLQDLSARRLLST